MATEILDTVANTPQIRQTQLLIDGKWVDAISGKTFATINPATEEVIAEVAEGDAADIDLAVKAARKAFESGPWSKMDARDRGRLIYRLADLIEENIEELAALESLDNGKPIRDSRAADLPLVIDCLRYYAGWADKIEGTTIPIRGNHFCYTRREPLGVAGQIIPWNFPLLMVAWKWAPALTAGCTIVMKPAEQTPLSCLRLAELALEAGIPPGVINVVPGYGPTAGAALVKHPDVDKIAFTGEDATAKNIMADAAATLKRLTFELGGKSPNVVFADCDLDAAVAGAEFGLFFNQGQCCCAGSRLFVEESVHEEFVAKIVAKAAARKLGDPLNPETTQGPQVDRAQMDKILSYIQKGTDAGAKCVTGGSRFGSKGYFVEPTVFDHVTDEMSIATDEIFGPVLSILPFKNVDEVVTRANNTHFGLAAAVWTSDVKKAHLMASQIKAGTVWVNCYDVFDAAAPFGGFKRSGIGRELGAAGLASYTELKTVTMNLD
ncbi:aldehyde dehydrogenase family protein [Gimesia maris]|uniref:NAD/NADP-dependent betaine aldehyde dehydrogenase n=1 Tax=Gimesia maris TaxID=122 RepID=A0ABX5YNM4_9PLAN|nr:aldehyde dehydrogenase family protein [Gimesia maris]EDL62339.1 aldehyde dehydrogenase [Gimesia maris DSM 8797]QEG17268.1 NAD/NADP-dependent betaine aldehyde dehydrogenase [Gimesia maris]QGQ29635.1 aldehyde dehydrogenase family protein [Gimesia maris]